MAMLSPCAASSLEKARLNAKFEEFVSLLCDTQRGALELSGIQTLISDALNIPDLEIARRWVNDLLSRGQTSQDVARIVANISSRERRLGYLRPEHYGMAIDDEESADLCEATLYWNSFRHSDFSEDRSLKYCYLANGRLVKLVFDIEALEDVYTAIRLDISNRPGAYLVDRLRLLSSTGEQLWRWSGGAGDLSDMADVELTCSHNEGALGTSGLAANGHDPQFKLIVDEGALAQISQSGGRLELIFRAFV